MTQWDDFKYLLAVKEHGNLINAAKVLKTNPTTVSRHIKRLSETYEQTLFTRTGNGEWQLTPRGHAFANAAKKCQQEIDALSDLSRDQEIPQIKISALEFIVERYLAPSISEFFYQDKKVSLTLDCEDRNVSLAFGEADLAIRMARPTSGRLVASKVGEVAMSIFCVDGADTDYWVGLPEEYDWVPEMKMALDHFGRPPDIRMGSFSGIRRVALEGGMAGIGPQRMISEWPELEIVGDETNAIYREIWSVFHESRRNDKSLLAARDWVKSCFDRSTPSQRPQPDELQGAA